MGLGFCCDNRIESENDDAAEEDGEESDHSDDEDGDSEDNDDALVLKALEILGR